jgi:hypothetical protein
MGEAGAKLAEIAGDNGLGVLFKMNLATGATRSKTVDKTVIVVER